MKRSLSDSHIKSCSSAKRHQTRCADVRSPRASPSVSTQETLYSWLQSVGQPLTQEERDNDSDIMAAPPTPRSTTSHSRGRVARHDARSRSSRRTPSPSKPTPQTYRTRNLHHANVQVRAELPHTIDDELRQVLGITSWEDPVAGPDEPRFNDAVECYFTDSIRNDEDCALEGEWKTSLSTLIRKLLPTSCNELKMNTSEKLWNSALKPKGPSLDEGDDNSETRTSRSSQAALPSFNPNNAAAAFSGPLPSLPPSTPSVATSINMEGVNPFYISTPKPDITVGLAHTTFKPWQQRSLVVLQTSQTILSDPHAADMGLRFPFLVVEAKGLSLNGSLVSAQNQAAVSGAAMLAILRDLDDQVDGCGARVPDIGATSQETPALCISIVTMGPIHDLNVHFMENEKYFMCPFQTYRTTLRKDAHKFVALLFQILEWGKKRYKEGIMEKLDRVRGSG